MTIEGGMFYNPYDGDAKSAFRTMDARHFLLGDTYNAINQQPVDKLQTAAQDYLLSGIAYLANCAQDPYLEELAEAAWWPIQKDRISVVNTLTTVPELQNARPNWVILNRELPGVYAFRERSDEPRATEGVVLVPTPYIFSARENPLEALAMTAWTCSLIRDYDNGRIFLDSENITPRAVASLAQFANKILSENPDAVLKPSILESVRLYPQGIDSLDPKLRYKGIDPQKLPSRSKANI